MGQAESRPAGRTAEGTTSGLVSEIENASEEQVERLLAGLAANAAARADRALLTAAEQAARQRLAHLAEIRDHMFARAVGHPLEAYVSDDRLVLRKHMPGAIPRAFILPVVDRVLAYLVAEKAAEVRPAFDARYRIEGDAIAPRGRPLSTETKTALEPLLDAIPAAIHDLFRDRDAGVAKAEKTLRRLIIDIDGQLQQAGFPHGRFDEADLDQIAVMLGERRHLDQAIVVVGRILGGRLDLGTNPPQAKIDAIAEKLGKPYRTLVRMAGEGKAHIMAAPMLLLRAIQADLLTPVDMSHILAAWLRGKSKEVIQNTESVYLIKALLRRLLNTGDVLGELLADFLAEPVTADRVPEIERLAQDYGQLWYAAGRFTTSRDFQKPEWAGLDPAANLDQLERQVSKFFRRATTLMECVMDVRSPESQGGPDAEMRMKSRLRRANAEEALDSDPVALFRILAALNKMMVACGRGRELTNTVKDLQDTWMRDIKVQHETMRDRTTGDIDMAMQVLDYQQAMTAMIRVAGVKEDITNSDSFFRRSLRVMADNLRELFQDEGLRPEHVHTLARMLDANRFAAELDNDVLGTRAGVQPVAEMDKLAAAVTKMLGKPESPPSDDTRTKALIGLLGATQLATDLSTEMRALQAAVEAHVSAATQAALRDLSKALPNRNTAGLEGSLARIGSMNRALQEAGLEEMSSSLRKVLGQTVGGARGG